MGMYTQLHLHEGDNVRFDATGMKHNSAKINLAISHHGGFISDLAITMTMEQAAKLRDELNSVIKTRRAPDTTVYGQGAGND